MTYTRTDIKKQIYSLVSDRLRVIQLGLLKDDGTLQSKCHLLKRELDKIRHIRVNAHNHHMAFVRKYAHHIFALAATISNDGKRHQRDAIFEMIENLTNHHHDKAIQTHQENSVEMVL